jgi:hypothetical protein
MADLPSLTIQRFHVGDVAFMSRQGKVEKVEILEVHYTTSPYVTYRVSNWATPIFDTLLYKTKKDAQREADKYGRVQD